MGRRPCCEKEGLNRGAWSAEEDKILVSYIQTHGQGKWRDVPHSAGLMRCGKSCRLRWLNYLRPDIKRGNITIEEEDLILRLHKLLGNRWSLIAGRLPGRTDNEIKNYWNTNLSKRLVQANKVQDSSTKQLDESKVNNSGTLTDSQPVIRTKAFRCKKVVIPNCLLDNDRDHQIQMAADKNILRGTDPSSASSGLRHINNNDNYSPEEFLKDFNIDDLLVSDILLNSDSCPPSKLQVFNDCDDLDRVIGVDDGDQNGLEQYVSCDDVIDDFPLLSGHDDDDDQTVHRTMSFDENRRDVNCYDPLQPNDQGLELNALSWFMNLDDDDHESHWNIG